MSEKDLGQIQAIFHFYDQLNDFLARLHKDIDFPYQFASDQTIKHLVEALGVPHPEVEKILANGQSVNFSYLPKEGDYIEVYPVDLGAGQNTVQEIPLRPPNGPRFVLDLHLGRLAVYLRMLGFDTLYRNDFPDEELAEISEAERRWLLTRDRRLLMRSAVTYGYWVRPKEPAGQLMEVARRFHLAGQITPFKRCMRCNGLLRPVPKSEIIDQLLPLTKKYYEDFHICPDCGQIYWRGSHYERMQALVEQVKKLESSDR